MARSCSLDGDLRINRGLDAQNGIRYHTAVDGRHGTVVTDHTRSTGAAHRSSPILFGWPVHGRPATDPVTNQVLSSSPATDEQERRVTVIPE